MNFLERRIIKENGFEDDRSPYLRDRDRILFSRSFRRLGFKTQIITPIKKEINDHIRNRLTHSLEVLQISTSIARYINKEYKKYKLDISLCEAISLGHDIGHCPYGHIGEKAIFKFVFDENNNEKDDKDPKNNFKGKLRHNFQSLKVCCFLEKQYYPDFYGLNLTVATLDGIFKHTKMSKEELDEYNKIFSRYCDVFWKENEEMSKNIDIYVLDYFKTLFEYRSPYTIEGICVALSDEIAQICHDVEDLRRIGGIFCINIINDVYEEIKKKLEELISKESFEENIKKIFDEFKEAYNNSNIIKVERLYTKIIIKLALSSISKILFKLKEDTSEDDWKELIRDYHLGSFDDLINIIEKKKVEIDEINIYILKLFEDIQNIIKNSLDDHNIARWDVKGKDLYLELCKYLYDIMKDQHDIFKIFPKNMRKHLKLSYKVGKKLEEDYKIGDLRFKVPIWDYLAGMTDSYIIKEYESIIFKKVNIL
ncbi:deoxyguanosinetriphosphate triphosphohydrolase [Methanocaldococcus infernus ME]|uniref:Deoxyguanosinetriphosphate triphosphohydrolase n=1 Tax=Methanocaldococcus infernus (strain DSM 11812 / JCM 15783 / ME) TaxID=573063 RepID=D5VU53_METIM|nr:dNTP triphosphohydrolase [Methanocaldococcus infernus]ADG14106.1 deoxyguanosinetriphosphate triphosphohydrolase [Methanocaldococcus infernus ME]